MSFLHFIRKAIFLTNMYILKKAVAIGIKDIKSRGIKIDEKNPIQRMEFRDGAIRIYLRPPPCQTVTLTFINHKLEK